MISTVFICRCIKYWIPWGRAALAKSTEQAFLCLNVMILSEPFGVLLSVGFKITPSGCLSFYRFKCSVPFCPFAVTMLNFSHCELCCFNYLDNRSERSQVVSVKHTLSQQHIVRGDNVTLWLVILLNLTHYLDSSAHLAHNTDLDWLILMKTLISCVREPFVSYS